MLNKLNSLRDREDGFTLIELLIVVIIIGILAAIALPIFLNQQRAAYRAEVQSDVRNTVGQVAVAAFNGQDPTAVEPVRSGTAAQESVVVSGTADSYTIVGKRLDGKAGDGATVGVPYTVTYTSTTGHLTNNG